MGHEQTNTRFNKGVNHSGKPFIDFLFSNVINLFYVAQITYTIHVDGAMIKYSQQLQLLLCIIACGEPQGYVLGLLSCFVSINDLCNVSHKLLKVLFADDTSVFIHRKTLIK